MARFLFWNINTFHATRFREVASQRQRTVQGQDYSYFYNPMWQQFGNLSGQASGTFYYDNSGKVTNYFWHVFDQVLVRPDLLNRFDDTSLKVLTSAAGIF